MFYGPLVAFCTCRLVDMGWIDLQLCVRSINPSVSYLFVMICATMLDLIPPSFRF